MKNIFKYYLVILCIGFMFSGCLPDPAKEGLVYKGPTVVEFKNQNLGMLRAPLDAKGVYRCTAQTDSSRTVNQNANSSFRCNTAEALAAANARGTDTVFVQLVGPQRSSDTELTFGIKSLSTAVEGVHYDFRPAGNRKVIIPANKSVGYILIDIKPTGLTTAGESVRLGLDLLGNDEIKATKFYDDFYVTFRRF